MGALGAVWHACLAGIACAAVVGGTAHGAVRYAQPGAMGPEPCTRDEPCGIGAAVNGHADGDVREGDVIRLLGGEYILPSGLSVGEAVTIRAENPDDPPVLVTGGIVRQIAAGSFRLVDLEIEHNGSGSALVLVNGDVAERVSVKSNGEAACEMNHDSFLRNSLCVQLADGAALDVFSGSASTFPRAVNVTAVAPYSDFGTGIRAVQEGMNQQLRFEAVNTIAQGAEDVFVSAPGGGSATARVTLRNSNYSTTQIGSGGQIIDGGGNQAAEPVFAAAFPAPGDFRTLKGSPTRDAGTTSEPVGTLDLGRVARVQGKGVDIGAYEFDVPPQTRITRKPKRVLRVPGRKGLARFRFTSSEGMSEFECRLRGGKRSQRRWRACESPRTYSVRARKRKYVFQVRAIDGAGNRDGTPARARFRVRSR